MNLFKLTFPDENDRLAAFIANYLKLHGVNSVNQLFIGLLEKHNIHFFFFDGLESFLNFSIFSQKCLRKEGFHESFVGFDLFQFDRFDIFSTIDEHQNGLVAHEVELFAPVNF